MPYAIRRPTLDDAAALHALMCACDVAAIGRPDTTLDDVREELREPDLDLDRDAWIAVDDSGVATGCGFVLRQGDGDLIDLDMYTDPSTDGLDAPLWDLLEARAAEIGATLGHPHLRLHVGIHRTDERRRETAGARGYAPATAFYRMRIDHTRVQPPTLPGGVRIEVAGADERLRRAAHAIDNASFAEHFGFAERTYDWWQAKFDVSASISWDLVRVASVDGVPAGVALASTQFVEDENCGYVASLGVLAEYRGRGLGRLLLLDAFANDAALGRAGTLLHVDANNVTPALGLYESVGMHTVLVIDSWLRTVAI